jgi:hypothetical protein
MRVPQGATPRLIRGEAGPRRPPHQRQVKTVAQRAIPPGAVGSETPIPVQVKAGRFTNLDARKGGVRTFADIGTSWSEVSIDWDNGESNSVRHNDMAQVQRVPVKA